MDIAMRFIHLLGAITVGYYVMFPLFLMRIIKMDHAARSGYVNGIYVANRIGQYILILQFVTGGYLIWKNNYSLTWIITVITVFTLLAAFAGLMGKPMRMLMHEERGAEDVRKIVHRLQYYSVFICLCFIILVILMKFTTII